MYMVQDRDRRWALVNALMNFWVPYKAGNFLVSRMTLVRGISHSPV